MTSPHENDRDQPANDAEAWDPFSSGSFTEIAPEPKGLDDYEASIAESYQGDFHRLIGRLLAERPLHIGERYFLASLLSGSDPYFSVKHDRRVRTQRYAVKRKAIADFVHMRIRAGVKRTTAYDEAEEAFPRRNPRPATAREAYREFYPDEFYGAAEEGEEGAT